MTKKLIKLLKEVKEEFTQGFSNGFAKQTGRGINITLNHDAVRSAGFLFAMYVHYENGKSEIMVDDEFNIAPKGVREFIIWHEIGHIDHHHTEYLLEDELDADRFAAKKVGNDNAIEALKYMWTRLATIDASACISIPSRLKALDVDVSDMYIRGINGKVFHEPELRAILEGRYK